MQKLTALVVALATAAGLSACSQNAQDQTAQAGNAVAADVSATTTNAGDRIDLSGFDWDTTASGNQRFTFVGLVDKSEMLGGGFTPGKGQVWYEYVEDSAGVIDATKLKAELDGNAGADFQIDILTQDSTGLVKFNDTADPRWSDNLIL